MIISYRTPRGIAIALTGLILASALSLLLFTGKATDDRNTLTFAPSDCNTIDGPEHLISACNTPQPPIVIAVEDNPAPPPAAPHQAFWQQWPAQEALARLKHPPVAHSAFFSRTAKRDMLDKPTLNQISRHYGLPDDILYFQWFKENRGECQQTSHKGAAGCFQFMKQTAIQFNLIQGKEDHRRSPSASADTAARYLSWLLVLFYGDEANPADWTQLRHALAAYNAGHRYVNRNGTLSIPSFTETQRYVYEIEELTTGRALLVKWGDTLEKISKRTGLSVQTLLRANPDITHNHSLKANTMLLLPDPQTGMSKVLITRGMTLSHIQRGTGVSLQELIRANKLVKPDTLHIGQFIFVPAQIMSEAAMTLAQKKI